MTTPTGSKVRGGDGQANLDCGGFGVFLLGHCHPAVVAADLDWLAHALTPAARHISHSPTSSDAKEQSWIRTTCS